MLPSNNVPSNLIGNFQQYLPNSKPQHLDHFPSHGQTMVVPSHSDVATSNSVTFSASNPHAAPFVDTSLYPPLIIPRPPPPMIVNPYPSTMQYISPPIQPLLPHPSHYFYPMAAPSDQSLSIMSHNSFQGNDWSMYIAPENGHHTSYVNRNEINMTNYQIENKNLSLHPYLQIRQNIITNTGPLSAPLPPPPPPPLPPQQILQAKSNETILKPKDIKSETKKTLKKAERPSPSNYSIRLLDDFNVKKIIGNGTFGQVQEAIDRRDGARVAIKFVKMEKEKNGVPITALREIRLLHSMNHPNILSLREVICKESSRFSSKRLIKDKCLYLVFDYIENDLSGLIELCPQDLTPLRIKSFMLQLLEGLHYIHHKKIIHRDLKCANLLITRSGYLKIADWGLARIICDDPQRQYTQKVVTRWYRPPELLLLTKQYNYSVDMWSAGCIFSEMILRRPLFPGKDEIDQMWQIIKILGTPTVADWPTLNKMPDYNAFRLTYEGKLETPRFVEKYQKEFLHHRGAMDLILNILTFDPEKRLTAESAREHSYFSMEPCIAKYGEWPPLSSTGFHEQEAKIVVRNQQERRKQEVLQRENSKRIRTPVPKSGSEADTNIFSASHSDQAKRPRSSKDENG